MFFHELEAKVEEFDARIKAVEDKVARIFGPDDAPKEEEHASTVDNTQPVQSENPPEAQ